MERKKGSEWKGKRAQNGKEKGSEWKGKRAQNGKKKGSEWKTKRGNGKTKDLGAVLDNYLNEVEV
jgi:hypothetical protein